jgi:spoIIIJ-associated protein
MTDIELIGAIEEYVKDFTKLMNVEALVTCSIEAADDENKKVVSIEYVGDDLGYMIGNRGSHLRGLQYILSMLINNKFVSDDEERLYVNVDVSGYKRQRYEKIEAMAKRKADDSRIMGEAVDMEPMPAAERRIVHMTLAEFDDVSTESHGEGKERHVRITPKNKKPANDMDMFEDEVEADLVGNVKEE